MKKKSQKQRILEAMEQGYGISPALAVENFACYRLAARIYDLRKDGHKVKETRARFGKVQYSVYSLDK